MLSNNRPYTNILVSGATIIYTTLLALAMPSIAAANTATFGYKIQTPAIRRQEFGKPVIVENGLPYLIDVDKNGVEQKTLVTNPMLGSNGLMNVEDINSGNTATKPAQQAGNIQPRGSTATVQPNNNTSSGATQEGNAASNVIQLDTHKFLGPVHKPGAVMTQTKSNAQNAASSKITITYNQNEDIKRKNKAPKVEAHNTQEQATTTNAPPVMIMADTRHPSEQKNGVVNPEGNVINNILHKVQHIPQAIRDAYRKQLTNEENVQHEMGQSFAPVLPKNMLNKKQQLTLKHALPAAQFKEKLDWNFQLTPPNIGQKSYAPPNDHLIPVTFAPEIDIKTFYYTKHAENTHILRALLGQINDINMQDQNGNTLLIYAIAYSNHDALILLLHHGIDPEITNNSGFTPLHLASYLADEISAIALIQNGANVNIVDSKGNTPIMYAAATGNINIVKRLLDNSALLNVVNSNGLTVLDFADTAPNRVIREYISARY